MKPSEYKQTVLARESADYKSIKDRLNTKQIRMLHSSIGLCTEAGELIDQIKKHVYYGKKLDETNIKEELGDIMWYLNVMLDVFGWDLEEVLQVNYEKLHARYGDKFSEDRAINRDLDTERKILEK